MIIELKSRKCKHCGALFLHYLDHVVCCYDCANKFGFRYEKPWYLKESFKEVREEEDFVPLTL
jgi:hypothetical protein